MNESKSSSPKRGSYVCYFENCQACFCRPSRLEQHVRVHTGERPFRCSFPNCDKCYTRAFHLKRHVRASHEPKAYSEGFLCPVEGCNQVFTSQVNLRKHHWCLHKKRQFKCTYCHLAFHKNQHLRVHEYQHTGIRPFVCEHEGCRKAFVVPSKLKTHMKIHQKYHCEVPGCGRLLANWTQLRKHRHLEHPQKYQCNSCSREFVWKSQLKVHAVVHQETREVFHCPYEKCPRYYYYESNLYQHIRATHEGRLHECPHEGCGRKLSTKDKLLQHQKLHDPDRPLPRPRQKKKRKPRKDKGTFKETMAVKLSGFHISSEKEQRPLSETSFGESALVVTQMDSSAGETHHMGEKVGDVNDRNMRGCLLNERQLRKGEGVITFTEVVAANDVSSDEYWREGDVNKDILQVNGEKTKEEEDSFHDGLIDIDRNVEKKKAICSEGVEQLPVDDIMCNTDHLHKKEESFNDLRIYCQYTEVKSLDDFSDGIFWHIPCSDSSEMDSNTKVTVELSQRGIQNNSIRRSTK